MRPLIILVACASLVASAVTRTPTATPAMHSGLVEGFSFPEEGLAIRLDSNFAGFQAWCTAPICMATCARLGYRCYRCVALSCMCSNGDC